jgi:hypothetical protein
MYEIHHHNLKDMQKANDGQCDGVQRPPHTVNTHPPSKGLEQSQSIIGFSSVKPGAVCSAYYPLISDPQPTSVIS